MKVKGYFLPCMEVESEKKIFRNKFGEVEVEVPHTTEYLVKSAIERMENTREYLLKLPVRKIAESVGRASKNLSDKKYSLRKKLEKTLPVTTNLSPEMVSLSIDIIADTFTEDNMIEMLYSELGDPEYLDKFKPSKAGKSKAFGKNIIINVFGSGGVPGIQVLGIVNGLLIKSAVFSKPDSSEPILPVVYCEAISDVDPKLAENLVVLPWEGGNPKYSDVENYVFGKRGENDAVIVYGSKQTINTIRRMVNRDSTFIGYPPRTSIIVIGKGKLNRNNIEDLTYRVAMDVCMYDQKACFSPQIIYTEEGGEISPEEFSEALAQKINKLNKKYPVGELTDDAKAKVNERKRTYIAQTILGKARVYESEGGVIIFDRNKTTERPITYRTVQIIPIESLDEFFELIKPFKDDLQTIGLEVGEKEFEYYVNSLSSLESVSRITRPGSMYRFPLSIHHDGKRNYEGLIRWIDLI